ncbi:hypothetical protein CYMTET_42777 [Cymbomonas tetramitiformis]|uniref:Uncharacterized protein n=1 Tax=Cymbomonas tetramitiformis TaxID=36881 RepID=A0AAE0C4S9_9CHLO|nr:hypothetical protein CYMTET_42777 [Cymbomonas tetramitiformis]|eukprot:gene7374-8783_t
MKGLWIAVFVSCAVFPRLAFSQFIDVETTQADSHRTLVCGVPSVESVQTTSTNDEIRAEIDVPLPSKDESDEIAFALVFGNLSVANKKLAGTNPLSDLDLIFDPSGTAFSGLITDKCDDTYLNEAQRSQHYYVDERQEPNMHVAMIANRRRCLQTRYSANDVNWTSVVQSLPAAECGLGMAKWYVTFNIARWLSAVNMDANSVIKELVNGGQLYTFPMRIFVTATSKTTTYPETFYSSYRFQLFQRSSVFSALSVKETQMEGYRAHFIENFVQVMGDSQLLDINPLLSEGRRESFVKLTFDLVFYKEADHTAMPKIETDITRLRMKIAEDTSPFRLANENGVIKDDGTACLTIGDDVSTMTTVDPKKVLETDTIFQHTIASKNGSFYKQTLSVVCYLVVYEDNQKTALSMNTDLVVPLRLEYTHTYTDINTGTLMTDPTRDPIAIFTQTMNFEAITEFQYETPLKGLVYKIPQGKINSIDRRTWTENDVRMSMINAFGTIDEPRQVRSVSVDTPIAGAITFQNNGDMGRYNLKLITGFLMANMVQTKQFLPHVAGTNTEAPIDVTDPCNLMTFKSQNDIIGLSTLYSDTESDVYTGRLSTDVKHLLEDVDKNSFYVGKELFEINQILKTDPFTSNYLLREASGAQDVIFLPFLPKFRIANNRDVDTYETRVCMIVEVEPYTGGVLPAAARRLLVVEGRSTNNHQTNAIDNKFTITSADYRVTAANFSSSERNSDVNVVVNVNAHGTDDDSFTNTNWTLSVVIMVLGVLSAALIIIMVILSMFIKKKKYEIETQQKKQQG